MIRIDSVLLIVAGSLALLGAAVHGAGGEVLVVRRLSPGMLPASRLGGPNMTMAMIHASWHMTTVAFLAAGIALMLSGTVVEGDASRALAMLAAGAFTGFAAVAVVSGAAQTRSLRPLFEHPGPAILIATAGLAWWGAL
ncbi:MAG: hypothetical protein ACRDL6_05660 [Solirubrobacterales bacterium]